GQRLEPLVADRPGELVPGQRPHRLVARPGVLGHDDLARGTAVQVGPPVRLHEMSGYHPGTEPCRTGVRDVLAREQAEEVGFAGSVRAEHGDPLAVPDLQVERPYQR